MLFTLSIQRSSSRVIEPEMSWLLRQLKRNIINFSYFKSTGNSCSTVADDQSLDRRELRAKSRVMSFSGKTHRIVWRFKPEPIKLIFTLSKRCKKLSRAATLERVRLFECLKCLRIRLASQSIWNIYLWHKTAGKNWGLPFCCKLTCNYKLIDVNPTRLRILNNKHSSKRSVQQLAASVVIVQQLTCQTCSIKLQDSYWNYRQNFGFICQVQHFRYRTHRKE